MVLSWIIHVFLGVVIGVMFSVAYPDYAISINDSIQPTIQSIGELGLEKFNEILNHLVTNFINSGEILSQ